MLIGLFVLAPDRAPAADITVDAGGVCTLAEAIDSANNNNANGNGCVDGVEYEDDIITLETDIVLGATLPPVTGSVILEGQGHAIDGNDDSSIGSVLRIAADGDLTLNEAIITGGYADSKGGGVYNEGAVTLTNSTVSGNTASSSGEQSLGGGIYNHNEGLVILTNSTVSGNHASQGGGIYSNYGTILVTDSAISGNTGPEDDYGGGGICSIFSRIILDRSVVSNNTAVLGGGIYNAFGSVILTDSTIRDNTGPGDGSGYGGGIYNSNYGSVILTRSVVVGNTAVMGGGINNISGTIMLTNSTISGNYTSTPVSAGSSAGGGIYNNDTVILIHSTASRNYASTDSSSGTAKGGGIYNYGTVILSSSIISGNRSYDAGDEVENYGTVHADDFNLLGEKSGDNAKAFSGFAPGSSDITATSDGTDPTALSAIIFPLADNGGRTMTHALVPGSPAVDLDITCSTGLTTDQRGEHRPVGAGCDAGAFEGSVTSGGSKAFLPALYFLLLR